MPLASYSFGQGLLTVLAIFFLVIWIWILILIISDLFRDHEESGWFKAIWLIALVFLPFITALIYLIVRGPGMQKRAIHQQAEVQKQMNQYIREQAADVSPASELEKLSKLKADGTISEEEFQTMKAKITS